MKRGEAYYEVKWENYQKTTWEPKSNIPGFIINYHEKTGNTNIPAARINNTKVVGRRKYIEVCNKLFKLT